MAGDEAAFTTFINATLERWLNQIEDLAPDVDGDLHDGVLTLKLEDGRTIILNRHIPLRQLWYSSPLSGASHYSYDAAACRWSNTRGGIDLTELLSTELTHLLGTAIVFAP